MLFNDFSDASSQRYKLPNDNEVLFINGYEINKKEQSMAQ